MKILNNKIVKILTVVLLIFLWVILTATYVAKEDLGLKSLDSRYSIEQFKNLPSHRDFRKGDVFSSEFLDPYPNLGTIGIRFNIQEVTDQDKLEFRIKENGSTNWFYRAVYSADQFRAEKFSHFNFGQIKDSKGKNYYFELESISNATGSAISLNSEFPTFISRHYFDKSSLYFIVQKAINLFTYNGFASHFISYSLPLFFYLFFLAFGLTFHFPIALLFVFLIIDVFFVSNRHDALTTAIIFSWLLPALKFKIEYRVPVYFALCLVLIFPIFLTIGLTDFAEKLATWSYLFFTLAIIQKIYELVFKPEKILGLSEFLNSCRYALKIMYQLIVGEIKLTVQTIEQKLEMTLEKDQLALLLELHQLGRAVASTVIIASRFSAFIICSTVLIIRLALRFGPYILLIWLVKIYLTNLIGYSKFYTDFFITNQTKLFWSEMGNTLILISAISFVVFLFTTSIILVRKKLNLRVITLLAAFFIFLITNINRGIFNKRTYYQYGAVIWSVTPKDTSEAWVDVTIYGRNFKNLPFKGEVYIGDVEQRVISWSDKEVVFRTNPTTTKSGKIKLITLEGKETNEIDFKYDGYR